MIGEMPAVLSLYIHKVLIFNNMQSKVISVKPTKIVSRKRKIPTASKLKASYVVYVRQLGQKEYYYYVATVFGNTDDEVEKEIQKAIDTNVAFYLEPDIIKKLRYKVVKTISIEEYTDHIRVQL